MRRDAAASGGTASPAGIRSTDKKRTRRDRAAILIFEYPDPSGARWAQALELLLDAGRIPAEATEVA